MKIKQKNEGITVIALIITIILMLILAGVSISMIINDELFDYAGQAVEETEKAKNEEQELVNSAINNYIKPNLKVTGHDGETFSKIYTKTESYTDIEGNTAVIPKGFAVGTSSEINKISTGLVISDADGNEFVWIPVEEDLVNPYTTSSYSEPTELTSTIFSASEAAHDSQETLNYYYGEKYYNYAENFKYAEEYGKMVDRVNKNHGFYIGRYETTIDESGNIGSKYNTEVLTTGTTLFTKGETNYLYRWYGLYMAQKNANVTGNKTVVQTAMIYGQLWDKTMEYIRTQKTAGKTNYNVDSMTNDWHHGSSIANSGQANKTTVGVDGAIGDVALNIWDLEANAYEWTQEAHSTSGRVGRGGRYGSNCSASYRGYEQPYITRAADSSRLILYIK